MNVQFICYSLRAKVKEKIKGAITSNRIETNNKVSIETKLYFAKIIFFYKLTSICSLFP